MSSDLAHSPSKAARTWRVGTHAERGPAVDGLPLHIRVIGPSTWRYHNDASKMPSFDTLALKSDVHLVRETGAERDTALDCLALRIRENVGPSTRRYHDDASKIPPFYTLAMKSYVRLARGDPSRVGCGGGLPRIAYSRNWALDTAISVPTRRTFPVLERSPSKAAHRWRLGRLCRSGAATAPTRLRLAPGPARAATPVK
jgi:hypothetical protein